MAQQEQQAFRESSLTVSECIGDVELCFETDCRYCGDKYTFLTKERATELRDWLNAFLSQNSQGA